MDTIPPQKIEIGTCAWSYDDWRGTFYPEGLAQGRWLEFYASHFSAVEADSTFYRTPSEKTVTQWAARTPEHFRFHCKMPKEITHVLALRNCTEQLTVFLERMQILGPKLGFILIQLPPTSTPAKHEKALREFLAALPPSLRFAVEFRHADWHVPRIMHSLEDHGICWAWSDTSPLSEQNDGAFEMLPQTAKFLYIRLMGDIAKKYHPDGSRIHKYGELKWPRDSSLENWAIKIRKHLPDCDSVFVACSNHFEGAAQHTCQRLGRLLDISFTLPAAGKKKAQGKQMQLL